MSVSEYIYSDYPVPPLQQMLQGIVGGYYNRYHLLKLEDGSWLCVYFDDCLALAGVSHYPAGYVRYTTTEERRMRNVFLLLFSVLTVTVSRPVVYL